MGSPSNDKLLVQPRRQACSGDPGLNPITPTRVCRTWFPQLVPTTSMNPHQKKQTPTSPCNHWKWWRKHKTFPLHFKAYYSCWVKKKICIYIYTSIYIFIYVYISTSCKHFLSAKDIPFPGKLVIILLSPMSQQVQPRKNMNLHTRWAPTNYRL